MVVVLQVRVLLLVLTLPLLFLLVVENELHKQDNKQVDKKEKVIKKEKNTKDGWTAPI